MIKNIWSLICKESKIDQETNNISIIDAYESLQFDLKLEKKQDKDAPLVLPFSFELLSLFYRDEKKKEERMEEIIHVLDPDSNKLGEFKASIIFKENQNRVRSRVKFDTIALTKSGTYLFQVFTQKKVNDNQRDLVSIIPVDINLIVDGKSR